MKIHKAIKTRNKKFNDCELFLLWGATFEPDFHGAEAKKFTLKSELVLTKLDQGTDLHENLVGLHKGQNLHSKNGLINKAGCFDVETSPSGLSS